MITLSEVLEFISTQADDTDIERIYTFAKDRTRQLRDLRAAQVSVGANVRLANLSPKYLNDLTGEVISISGKRCTVRLTKKSTETLRWASQRFVVPAGIECYELGGVPLSSCVPQEVTA